MGLDAFDSSGTDAFVAALEARGPAGVGLCDDPTVTCIRLCPVGDHPDADGFNGPVQLGFSSDGLVLAIGVECSSVNPDCDPFSTVPNGGGVFIYERSGNDWSRLQRLEPRWKLSGDPTLYYQESVNDLKVSDDGNSLAYLSSNGGDSAINVWRRSGPGGLYSLEYVGPDTGNTEGMGFSGDGTSAIWMVPSLTNVSPLEWIDYIGGVWTYDVIFDVDPGCVRPNSLSFAGDMTTDGLVYIQNDMLDPSDLPAGPQIAKWRRASKGVNSWGGGDCFDGNAPNGIVFTPYPTGATAAFGDQLFIAADKVLLGDDDYIPVSGLDEGACFEYLLNAPDQPLTLQRTYRNPDPSQYREFTWGAPSRDAQWAVFKARYPANEYAFGGWIAKWETVNGIASYRPKYIIEGDPAVGTVEARGLRDSATHNAPTGEPWWATNQDVTRERDLVATIVCDPTSANAAIVGTVQSVASDANSQQTIIDLDNPASELPAFYSGRVAGLWSGEGLDICFTAPGDFGKVLSGVCPAFSEWTGGLCGTDPAYPTITWRVDDPGGIVTITILVCLATGGTALSFQTNETVLLV